MGRGPLGNTQHRRAQQGQRPRLSQLCLPAPHVLPLRSLPPLLLLRPQEQPLKAHPSGISHQLFHSQQPRRLLQAGFPEPDPPRSPKNCDPFPDFSALPRPLTACKQMTPAFSESSRSLEGRTGRGPEGLGERACGSGSRAQARFLSQLTGELNRLKAPHSELPSLTACLGPELPTTPLLPEAGR